MAAGLNPEDFEMMTLEETDMYNSIQSRWEAPEPMYPWDDEIKWPSVWRQFVAYRIWIDDFDELIKREPEGPARCSMPWEIFHKLEPNVSWSEWNEVHMEIIAEDHGPGTTSYPF